MSSSSFETEGSVAALLRRSLRAIARQVPEAHEALRAALDGVVVSLRVDDEALSVHGGANVDVGGWRGDAAVVVETTRAAILGVIDEGLPLTALVWDGRLAVRGALDAIATVYEALLAFAHGAVRSPDARASLARFREDTQSGE